MSSSEIRRLRLEILEQQQSLNDRGQTNAPTWFLGTVTGTPSTTVPSYVKVTPQSISGTPTEGGSATLASRAGTIMVYVLGPSAPTVGQEIMCWRAGGAWVGETCCGGPTGCPPFCLPCIIPQENLTMQWSGTSTWAPFNAPGSMTLTYDGVGTWTSPCLGPSGVYIDGSQKIVVSCSAGYVTVDWPLFFDSNCETQITFDHTCFSNDFTLVECVPFADFTCQPFNIHVVLGTRIDANIYDPNPLTGAVGCCVIIPTVVCASSPVVGATYSIWTDASKTTLLFSGTTDENGAVGPWDLRYCGTYYREVTAAGYQPLAGYKVFEPGVVYDNMFAAANADFVCCFCKIPKTLHYTVNFLQGGIWHPSSGVAAYRGDIQSWVGGPESIGELTCLNGLPAMSMSYNDPDVGSITCWYRGTITSCNPFVVTFGQPPEDECTNFIADTGITNYSITYTP